jgi:prepilin-type N-terminal cleavage/methylation domain-containing protein
MKQDAGFALLELMVALAILALVAGGLASGLQLAPYLRASSADTGLEPAELIQRLQSWILASHRAVIDEGGDDEAPPFIGSSTEIVFYRSRNGVVRTELALRDDFLTLASDGDDQALLPATAMTVAFADADGDEAVWLDEWIDRDDLPALVRIDLEGDFGRLGPNLTITLLGPD